MVTSWWSTADGWAAKSRKEEIALSCVFCHSSQAEESMVNGSQPILEPIEDEANVDKRRAEVGLSPLAEYRELLKRIYFPKETPKP
jgi:hypothetical protein